MLFFVLIKQSRIFVYYISFFLIIILTQRLVVLILSKQDYETKQNIRFHKKNKSIIG